MPLGSDDNLPPESEGVPPAVNDAAPPERDAGGVSAMIKRFNTGGGGSPRVEDHGVAVKLSSPAKAYSPKMRSTTTMVGTASASVVTPEPASYRPKISPSLSRQMNPVSAKTPISHAVTPPLERKPTAGSFGKGVEARSPSIATASVESSAQGQQSQRANRISGMIAAFEKTGSGQSTPAAASSTPRFEARAKAAATTVGSVAVPSAAQLNSEEAKATVTVSSYPKASVLDGASRVPKESKLPMPSNEASQRRHIIFSKTHPARLGSDDGAIASTSDVAASAAESLSSGLVLGVAARAKSYQVGVHDRGLRPRFVEERGASASLTPRQWSHTSTAPLVTQAEAPSSPTPMSAGSSKPDFGDLSPIRDAEGDGNSPGSPSPEDSPVRKPQATRFRLSEGRHASNSSLFQSRLVQFSKSLKGGNGAIETRRVSTKDLPLSLPAGTTHSVESTEETTETSSIDEESRVLSHDLSADDARQLEEWKEEDKVPLASLCDVSTDKPANSNETSPSTPASPSNVKELKSKFEVSIATATSSVPSSQEADVSQEGFEVAASHFSDLGIDISQRAPGITIGSLLRAEESNVTNEDEKSKALPAAELGARRSADSQRPVSLSLQARKPSNGDGPPAAPGTRVEPRDKLIGERADAMQIRDTPVSDKPRFVGQLEPAIPSSRDLTPSVRGTVSSQPEDVEPPIGPPTPMRVAPNLGILQTTDLSFLSSSREPPSCSFEDCPAPVVAEKTRSPTRGPPLLFKLAPNPKDTALSCHSKKRRGPNCDDSWGACPLSSATGRASSATQDLPVVDYTSVNVPLRAQPARGAPEPASPSGPVVAPKLAVGPPVAPANPDCVPTSTTSAPPARPGPVDLDATVEDSMEVAKLILAEEVEPPATPVNPDCVSASGSSAPPSSSRPVDLDVTVEDSMEVSKLIVVDEDVDPAEVYVSDEDSEELVSPTRAGQGVVPADDVPAPPDDGQSVEPYPAAEGSPRTSSGADSSPTSRIRKLAPNPKDTAYSMRAVHRARRSASSDGDVSGSSMSPRPYRPSVMRPPPALGGGSGSGGGGGGGSSPSSWSAPRSAVSQTNPIWTAMDGPERVKRWRQLRRRRADEPESSFDEGESSASERDPYLPEPLLGRGAAGGPRARGATNYGEGEGYPRPGKPSKKAPRAAASSSVMIEI